MAYAFVIGVSAQSATSDDGCTTSSIDTTGCDLLIIAVPQWPGVGAVTVSDSKGNTWTALTTYTDPGSDKQIRSYYCAAPTVGSGHTFTVAQGSCYSSIGVLGFSGAHATPADGQNGNSQTSGTSNQTGSVTPAEDNELFIAALTNWRYSDTTTIDSGFTHQINLDGNAHSTSIHIAYKIQTTGGAENPTWSWNGANATPSTLITFKAAASATNSGPRTNGGLTHSRLIRGGLAR